MKNLSSPVVEFRPGFSFRKAGYRETSRNFTTGSSPKIAVRFKVIVILFFLLFAPTAKAVNTLDMVINEIAWMGTKMEGVESKNWWRYEWLELYNNTGQTVSLNGWEVELYRTELDWSLGLKGEVSAKGYFLVVSSDKIFPNYDLNYSNLGGKFINGGQKVLLKDGVGQIIDEINALSGWFAGDNSTKQTMERKGSQLPGSDFSNWQTSQNPGGTPKAENGLAVKIEPESPAEPAEKTLEELAEVKPQPIPLKTEEVETTYPSGIVFNEILPSPEGPDETDEWIEILNQNNFEVDISGWQIADTVGKTQTYAFPDRTKISPNGFLVLSRPETKITLNNSGDGLNLFQPNENIIDSISYEKALLGQSYNRFDAQWVWSTVLTPGSKNIVPSLEEKKTEPKTETEKVEVKPQEVKETEAKKEIAAIGEQVPKETPSFPPLLIALSLAIFSGVIILTLKRKMKNLDLSKKLE